MLHWIKMTIFWATVVFGISPQRFGHNFYLQDKEGDSNIIFPHSSCIFPYTRPSEYLNKILPKNKAASHSLYSIIGKDYQRKMENQKFQKMFNNYNTLYYNRQKIPVPSKMSRFFIPVAFPETIKIPPISMIRNLKGMVSHLPSHVKLPEFSSISWAYSDGRNNVNVNFNNNQLTRGKNLPVNYNIKNHNRLNVRLLTPIIRSKFSPNKKYFWEAQQCSK